MTEMNPRPLHGLRVLDFSTTIAGPHCSRLLADMGADVVKVESPEGDLMRSRPVQRDGAGTMFGQLNAGKRSIVLDLKKPEAIAAVKKLVKVVDIVLENYRPGVMKRLGLDYPELAKINPKIIYGAISGYGQAGPAAGGPAYAPVIHASTGYDMAHLFYQQGRERPDNCGIFVADYASGAYAMGGILAALHQRHVTGKGQMVDVSMFETLVGMLLGEVNRAQFDFEMPSRPMYGPVEAKDGYVMLATASERTFQDMATAAGRRDWLSDPRFEKYADRRMNWAEFVDEFEAWSKTLTVQECVAVLEKHGVPCSPYLPRGGAGAAGRPPRPALPHRGQCRVLQVARPALPLLRLSLAKRPQGRRSRRAHEERARRSGAQRSGGRGAPEMIDPRTPILVGCGQITDTTGKPSSERSNVAFCAEAAGIALDDTRASIGADALGRKIDAAAVLEFFPDVSPRFASPFGRCANPPKSVANRLHAAPRQLLYTHSGGNMPQYLVNRFAEEIANGETELALICGAELLRSTQAARKAGLKIDWNEDPGGEPTRIGDKRFGFSDEEARHELRAAIHFYPLLENAIRGGLKRDVDSHMMAMGRLFERLAAVAKDNPLATRREGYSAERLATISNDNRWI